MSETYPVYLQLSVQQLSQLGLDPSDECFERAECLHRVPSPFDESLKDAPKAEEIWINRKFNTRNQIIAVALNIYLAEWDIVFCELMEDGTQKQSISSCFLPMFLNLYQKESDGSS